MAQIDFSNAVLEPVGNTHMNPYMSFEPTTNLSIAICDSSGTRIGSVTTKQRLVDESGKFVMLFIGSINSGIASSTEMYIGMGTQNPWTKYWKISNISFSGGDTFTLQIKSEFV